MNTPVDAIPDLSDVQVIIKTPLSGQAPQVVEDQVTYPLTTAMLSVPGASTVRGYSLFGDSYVYVIFEDGTDLYWARSRVLEYLNQVAGQLPSSAPDRHLGPDATGVGWIYEYALVDRSGRHDLAQLRSIQDWFLKYELQTVPGVAEVATIGGMVQPVPGGGRTRMRCGPMACRWPRSVDAIQRGQPRSRRLGHRNGRSRIHDSGHRLPAVHRGSGRHSAGHERRTARRFAWPMSPTFGWARRCGAASPS